MTAAALLTYAACYLLAISFIGIGGTIAWMVTKK